MECHCRRSRGLACPQITPVGFTVKHPAPPPFKASHKKSIGVTGVQHRANHWTPDAARESVDVRGIRRVDDERNGILPCGRAAHGLRAAGCGLLLDVNNVFVSATNHGYPAQAYLADFPLEYVGEIHLAGYSEQHDDEHAPLLIDSHDRAVADPVWALYRDAIARTGPIPTLIEWDSQLPAWPELRAQALAARRIVSEFFRNHTSESDAYLMERASHEA